MKRTLCAVGLGTLCLTWAPPPAHAITGAICISAKLNGSLKMRATGACKATEIQLGSFDGTTLQFSGINVQVVSGSGTTAGAVNGKGNLIVGYNEPGLCGDVVTPCNTNADCPNGAGACQTAPKTGSHNLIVGLANAYTSYGGLVAGDRNTISGPFASVSGGGENTASGFSASVSGGFLNSVSGVAASVSGGTGLTQPADIGWAAGSSASGDTIVGDFESP